MAIRGNNNGLINGDDVTLGIWACSLERILENIPEYMCRPGHPGRISRIPDNIRAVDKRAYEPYFLSIGPYHHGKPMVQSMEKTKRSILKTVLDAKPEVTLRDYFIEIKSIEPEVRGFYTDIEMDTETFMQLLLVDSIFILTSFCGMPNTHQRVEDIIDMSGENHTSRLLAGSFQHDLFLLENQLPMFLLRRIYALVYGGPATQLLSTMTSKVAKYLVNYAKVDCQTVIQPTTEIYHLLHIGHKFFRPTTQQEFVANQAPESTQMFRLGSATELYEAGVSFIERSNSDHHSLLDITFSKSGKLTMPSLFVDGNTNSLLRNLIALEQMKYPSMGLEVSAYAVLLVHLITTSRDAQLLRREEVIHHHLPSDKDMACLVNKLSVGLSFDYAEDKYSLKPLFQKLNTYSNQRVPWWKVWLKPRCFNDPWFVITLLATLVLVLSLVQAYYTGSYKHPYFRGQYT